MSRRHDIQDAQDVIVRHPTFGAVQVAGMAAPTDSVAGYAKSCLWQNLAGSAGTMLYVNIGTNSSSNWLAIA